jgi:hypothetical protein
MVIFLQECFDVLLLLLRECDHFERSCLVDIFDILHSQQRLLSKEFFILLNVFVICFRFLNLFASDLDQNISSRVYSKMTSESSLTKGSHSNLIFIDAALINAFETAVFPDALSLLLNYSSRLTCFHISRHRPLDDQGRIVASNGRMRRRALFHHALSPSNQEDSSSSSTCCPCNG